MRGWIVVMVVLSLPGAAAAGDGLDMDMATLVADLEATCKNFKADRLSPKLAVLESNAFKSFCGLSREGMVKSAARRREPLSSSQAQTFLGRGYWLLNGAGGQYWRLHLESKPVMTDLDRLFYALSLQPATANLDRFLYRYDWNLAYYLAMKSIDPRRLVANLRADRRFVGSVKDLWMAKYRFEMRTQVAQIDKIRGQFKGRGPEYDKIFSVGATGLRSWAAGWRKHKGDAARMHKILGQLLSGRKLSIEDCEAPMFEFMAKQARSLGWSHPLIEMSAGLAGVCARRRNDAALEYAALMALSYRDATIGRFSRAVSEVNRYVDELAERTGQEPVIKRNKLTSSGPIGSARVLGLGRAWGYENGSLWPSEQAFRIDRVSSVTINGIAFKDVRGTYAGKRKASVLVPHAMARLIKKGRWMRFKYRNEKFRLAKYRQHLVAAPVMVTNKKSKLESDPRWTKRYAGTAAKQMAPLPP